MEDIRNGLAREAELRGGWKTPLWDQVTTAWSHEDEFRNAGESDAENDRTVALEQAAAFVAWLACDAEAEATDEDVCATRSST